MRVHLYFYAFVIELLFTSHVPLFFVSALPVTTFLLCFGCSLDVFSFVFVHFHIFVVWSSATLIISCVKGFLDFRILPERDENRSVILV